MAAEQTRLAGLREVELWIARVRLGAVLFAVVEVGLLSTGYPRGYETYAWFTTAAFGVGAILIFGASARFDPRGVGLVALVFGACAICAYATIYSYEYGSPTRWALIFVVVEAALRYGLFGAVVLPVLLLPFLVFAEWWRVHHFDSGPGFIWDRVTFPFGVFVITGAIVGWLVNRLAREASFAEARAGEAETLRDQLGRRVDVLEAAEAVHPGKRVRRIGHEGEGDLRRHRDQCGAFNPRHRARAPSRSACAPRGSRCTD